MSATHILLVEDDPSLRRSLAKGLGEAGYVVSACPTLAAARAAWSTRAADLILLDLGLPDGDGLDWLAEVRQTTPGVPIVILTARDAVSERVRGLNSGADDYLVKPFAFPELLARIRARLREASGRGEAALRVADLEINLWTRTVRRGGRVIDCTPREFDLLVLLARHPGQAISRARLAEEVWKVHSPWMSMDNKIDVQISRLRDKLDRDAPVRLIQTVRGHGYLLRGDA